MATQLYDQDLYAWTLDQASKLRRLAQERVNLDIDLEHLAEEIESVGRSSKREVGSRLETILVHMLKIAYSPAYEPLNGWRGTVKTQRDDLLAIIEESPSLRNIVREEFPRRYKRAAEETKLSHIDLTLAPIPRDCPFDLETQVLDEDWLPEPRIRPPREC